MSSSDPKTRSIALNSKAIVFLSTPHLGCPLAKMNDILNYLLWPSTEVEELRHSITHYITIYIVDCQFIFVWINNIIVLKIVIYYPTNLPHFSACLLPSNNQLSRACCVPNISLCKISTVTHLFKTKSFFLLFLVVLFFEIVENTAVKATNLIKIFVMLFMSSS